MVKKFILAVFVASLFLTPNPAKAVNYENMTEYCMPGNTVGAFYLSLSRYTVWQSFRTDKNTLHGIMFGAKSERNNAKVKVEIYDLGTVNKIGEAYSALNEGSSYYYVPFDNIALRSGAYNFNIISLHDEDNILVYAIQAPCYDKGDLTFGGIVRTDADLIFGAEVSNTPENFAPVDNTTTTPDPTPDSNVQDDAPSSATSSASTSSPALSTKSPTSTTSNSGNTESIAPEDTVQPTATSTTTTEDIEPISAEDLAALNAMILEFEEGKPKGAFGLSGMVGRALTWPVFYAICGLIFLIIIVLLWRSIAKDKNTARATSSNKSTPEAK